MAKASTKSHPKKKKQGKQKVVKVTPQYPTIELEALPGSAKKAKAVITSDKRSDLGSLPVLNRMLQEARSELKFRSPAIEARAAETFRVENGLFRKEYTLVDTSM